jgi:Fe-S-cluster-containing dehydrogenase component
MACPFGVIDVSTDGKIIIKCDLCIERTKTGQGPACVEACPTGALKLADEKDLVILKRRLAAQELVSSTQKNKEKQKENTQ